MTIEQLKSQYTKDFIAVAFAYNMDSAAQLTSLTILIEGSEGSIYKNALVALKSKILDDDITASQIKTEIELILSLYDDVYLQITAISTAGGIYSIMALAHKDDNCSVMEDGVTFYPNINRVPPNSYISFPNGQVFYVNENSIISPSSPTVPLVRFQMYFESLASTIDGKKVINMSVIDALLREKAGTDQKFTQAELSSLLTTLGIPKDIHDAIYANMVADAGVAGLTVSYVKGILNKFNVGLPTLDYPEYEQTIAYLFNLATPEKRNTALECLGSVVIKRDADSANKLNHYYYVEK